MRRLLIRPGAIGDCVLTFPAMAHLRAAYTEVWAPSAVLPLAWFADRARAIAATGLDLLGVGELTPAEHLVRELRRFDSIVSWYGTNREEFREAIKRLDLPIEFYAALPPADFAGHAIDFFAARVGAPLGLCPRVRFERSGARDAVVIHPFSGSARKNWPLEKFRELAARLPLPVEWSAGPEEELMGARRFADLSELAGWMAGARLYIGNDSGISHVAAATGVPTLVLFGPSRPELWAPRGRRVITLRAQPLSEMSVQRVLDAANRLLDSP